MTVPAARRSVDGDYDRGAMLAAVRRATAAIADKSASLWNHFRECPVSPWGRCRNHRHEDRISCCNCDSCRWCWTGGPFGLAAARKAVHACRRPIGYCVSRVRGSVLASVRWLTAWIKTHWRRCLSNGSRPCSVERSARRILGQSPRARKASRPARNAATHLPHIRALASIRSSFCRIEGENSFAASAYAATSRPDFPILAPFGPADPHSEHRL